MGLIDADSLIANMEKDSSWEINSYDFGKIMEHIYDVPTQTRATELLEAENDGRVIVLPCAIGDTVYRAVHVHKCSGCPDNLYTHEKCSHCKMYADNGGGCTRVDERYVHEVKFSVDEYSFYTMKLLRDVFLTREEAEAALARR